MIPVDLHTHSAFSSDGRAPLSEMIETAYRKGVIFYGVSEHIDYDYRFGNILIRGKQPVFTDENAYFNAVRDLAGEYKPKRMAVLAGGELGFMKSAECAEAYLAFIDRHDPDFVINSTHTCMGQDCYFPEFFEGKSKESAYSHYLEAVRESLEAPYRYDVVAHIGYVSRNAPYPDKKIRYEDFADLYDDILKTIIAKDKILEVNSSARGAGSEFLPDADVLTRYFELGGRLVSYGSDAHDPSRILDKFDLVTDALKHIGFTHITVPLHGHHKKLEL